MSPTMVAIADIDISTERRDVNSVTVKQLADSIDQIGLQHPITIRQKDDQYILVAGRHRIEAHKKLGLEHVPANIVKMSDDDARLWEIAENLHRSELTKLERDENIAEWIRITERILSQSAKETKTRGQPEGGINAASRDLGIQKDEAYRAVKVASLTNEAKDAAREVGLDNNRTAMLAAASVAPEKQADTIRSYKPATPAKNRVKQKRKPRGHRLVYPVESEHDRDLRNLRGFLEASCESAREEFLATAQSPPVSALGSDVVCKRVSQALRILSGTWSAPEVFSHFAGRSDASLVSECIRPAAAWVAEFSNLWEEKANAEEPLAAVDG